ncbi:hypothetical protein SEA_REYNAULD_4 [Rhodococcus phage Reynauld]|uniref:Uncharacterized protein n=1 Tax=Rhodococcus phage Reynauld TaxID=3062845 RepID=A0ACD4UGV3_9CAUD|nr:hypothetical protein SEA_REYNAULD_4 [Rhodococcus phage Reynauld]
MEGRERSLRRSTTLAGGVIVRRVDFDTALRGLETTIELLAASQITKADAVDDLRNRARDLRALRHGGTKA